MPNWADIVQAVASVLSVLVTLGGVYYITHQIRESAESRRIHANGDLYDHQQKIHEFFFAHPELRPYFYEDVEPDPSSPLSQQVTISAEMIADFLEHIHLQLPALPLDISQGWEGYMLQLYDRSPALRKHLGANGRWYSEEYRDRLSTLGNGVLPRAT